MIDARLPSALRELRADLTRPGTIVLLAGITGVLTLMGPFETGTQLRPLPRLAYWAALAVPTYAAGSLGHIIMRQRLSGRVGAAGMAIFSAIAAAISVSSLVVALNALILGHLPPAAEMPGFLLTSGGIAAIVSLLFSALDHEAEGAAPPSSPPLLERLPHDKRGPLVAISAEDHYVRVRTIRGEEMVLMRLTDAIAQTHPARGIRVHRSHWVAIDQISAVRRLGERTELSMSHGPAIPVSRASLKVLKEAGLVPR